MAEAIVYTGVRAKRWSAQAHGRGPHHATIARFDGAGVQSWPMSEPDYIVDLSSRPSPQPTTPGKATPSPDPAAMQGRPWIAVHWKCCQTYSRIYRNKEGTAYVGRCPKCGGPVQATIGQGGTATRFFEAQ